MHLFFSFLDHKFFFSFSFLLHDKSLLLSLFENSNRSISSYCKEEVSDRRRNNLPNFTKTLIENENFFVSISIEILDFSVFAAREEIVSVFDKLNASYGVLVSENRFMNISEVHSP